MSYFYYRSFSTFVQLKILHITTVIPNITLQNSENTQFQSGDEAVKSGTKGGVTLSPFFFRLIAFDNSQPISNHHLLHL